MIIERLSQEHRNIEKLLAILERELEVFDRGDRPDYEVIRAVISYFEVYPEVYHHPQEDLVFAKLRTRDPVAAAKVGDLAHEHHKGAERLRQVAQAVRYVLATGSLYGSPPRVRDQVAELRDAGVQHLLCQTGFGDMSHDQNLASMRRFGEEVMPAFRT